jgi:hypothetical protein
VFERDLLSEKSGNMFLPNIGTYLTQYMASHPLVHNLAVKNIPRRKMNIFPIFPSVPFT